MLTKEAPGDKHCTKDKTHFGHRSKFSFGHDIPNDATRSVRDTNRRCHHPDYDICRHGGTMLLTSTIGEYRIMLDCTDYWTITRLLCPNGEENKLSVQFVSAMSCHRCQSVNMHPCRTSFIKEKKLVYKSIYDAGCWEAGPKPQAKRLRSRSAVWSWWTDTYRFVQVLNFFFLNIKW